MANSTHPVPHFFGGGRYLLNAMRTDQSPHAPMLPAWWNQTITLDDITGAGCTQTSTITIPASGFVSGRVSVVFTGGGLSSPVTVTADAAAGDANTDLATALEAAIATARAGTLAGVVANETVNTNVVTITFVAEIDFVTVAVSYDVAQVLEAQYSGTLQDGNYVYRFTGGGLGAAVDATVLRSGGSPAAITDMIIEAEAQIEALVATSLAGVVVSADDDASDLNTIQMAEGIADVTVTPLLTVPQTFTATFGGTATDGNYDLIFAHSSLPGPVTVRVVRSTTPATNADLAAAMETAVEAEAALADLIDDTASSDSGAVYTIVTPTGVTGLSITASAPSPGTLVVAETTPDITVTDATPAGPTITTTALIDMTLNTAFPNNAFPANVTRGWAGLYVSEAFLAGNSVLGDAADADGVLQSVSRTSTGWGSSTAGAEEADQFESAWDPILRVTLGASTFPTAGKFEVWIAFQPIQTGAW